MVHRNRNYFLMRYQTDLCLAGKHTSLLASASLKGGAGITDLASGEKPFKYK